MNHQYIKTLSHYRNLKVKFILIYYNIKDQDILDESIDDDAIEKSLLIEDIKKRTAEARFFNPTVVIDDDTNNNIFEVDNPGNKNHQLHIYKIK